MVTLEIPQGFAYPDMYRVEWQPEMPPGVNVGLALESEWARCREKITVRPGDRIAVGRAAAAFRTCQKLSPLSWPG